MTDYHFTDLCLCHKTGVCVSVLYSSVLMMCSTYVYTCALISLPPCLPPSLRPSLLLVQTHEDPNLGKVWFHGSITRDDAVDLLMKRELIND